MNRTVRTFSVSQAHGNVWTTKHASKTCWYVMEGHIAMTNQMNGSKSVGTVGALKADGNVQTLENAASTLGMCVILLQPVMTNLTRDNAQTGTAQKGAGNVPITRRASGLERCVMERDMTVKMDLMSRLVRIGTVL